MSLNRMRGVFFLSPLLRGGALVNHFGKPIIGSLAKSHQTRAAHPSLSAENFPWQELAPSWDSAVPYQWFWQHAHFLLSRNIKEPFSFCGRREGFCARDSAEETLGEWSRSEMPLHPLHWCEMGRAVLLKGPKQRNEYGWLSWSKFNFRAENTDLILKSLGFDIHFCPWLAEYP